MRTSVKILNEGYLLDSRGRFDLVETRTDELHTTRSGTVLGNTGQHFVCLLEWCDGEWKV